MASPPKKPVLSPKTEGIIPEKSLPRFLDLPPPAIPDPAVNNNENEGLAPEGSLSPPNSGACATSDPADPPLKKPISLFGLDYTSLEEPASQPSPSERRRQLEDKWQCLVEEHESETPHVFTGRSGGWHTLEEFTAGQKADLPWWKCCCNKVPCPRRILTLLLLFLLLACFWLLTWITLSATGPNVDTSIEHAYVVVVRSIPPEPEPTQSHGVGTDFGSM